MRIRKLMAAGMAMVATLAIAACGGGNGDGNGDATSGGGDGDGYRVAYIARAQVDSFAAWLANEMQAEAANYPDITLDVYDGQADDEVENRMIENAIANGYDAIIIQPNNGEAQRPYIEQSVAAGIVTITTTLCVRLR